ncbi:ATP-binding cassette domain-containing protein [Corynebacterium nuruki]|uniref:ABC transporter ATP-binding protein n=1 Tax=Corynebacterium nuruki TaxID=1032851 RepID=A0A3D4SYB2_9CORY|nr:ABC transporter ATP-binding protein [Corynebacterium nuruki]HCT14242.1 ABC transporter ATP-binding protein [Corynebacterium nuruki]
MTTTTATTTTAATTVTTGTRADAAGHRPPYPPHAGSVLDLIDLTASYGDRTAVRDLDLSLAAGETVALVGESGSGKSTTARAAVGLGGAGLTVTAAEHRILGTDATTVGPAAWRRLYRGGIGYIPQDTGEGLNPVRTIGSQLAEAVRQNGGTGRSGCAAVRQEVADALTAVGLDATLHARRHPHELSGGQRQRVLIALALIGDPALVIADEPTSSLDVTVQKQVLDLLERRVRETGAALLLITHDLGVAHARADRIVVLKGGRLIEQGTARTVLTAPQEDYTRDLVAAVPGRAARRAASPVSERTEAAEPVITARGLTRIFDRATGPAVDGVDFTLTAGRTLGIVGESGSGKSTTARILLGIEPFDAGEVTVLGRHLDGRGIRGRRGGDAVALSRRARLIHQDPTGSLDPRFTVADTVAEPLVGFGIGDRHSRRRRVADLLDQVALPSDAAGRRPAELSGGQRQRVAIARALAVEPDLLVLDEPVSALDVSVQARILDLLTDLQGELGLTYLFISHDLAVVRDIADEVAVMASGRVVDHGPAGDLFAHPGSDVTAGLLAAVPTLPTIPAQN